MVTGPDKRLQPGKETEEVRPADKRVENTV